MCRSGETVKTMSLLKNAAKRCVELLVSMDVEACEIASIIACSAWIISVGSQPEFLLSSVYFQQVAHYIPRPALLTMFSVLMAYQVVGVVLGGVPSTAVRTPAIAARRRATSRRWFLVRRAGVFAAIIVWGAIAKLMTGVAITPATVIYGGISASSIWGFWRLGLLVRVEEMDKAFRAAAAAGQDLVKRFAA